MKFRFAPSPTGMLHVGGARSALFNYLLARQNKAPLLLRIEDTDRERSTDENVEQILDALQWLGIDWDEGPLSQFERKDRHEELLQQLLSSGAAYRSDATSDEVKQQRERTGQGFRGAGSSDSDAAVRLRVPEEGSTVVEDLIRGKSSFENRLIDDFVIARSDGTVLYNFAVAVDDMDMDITDVVRGEDHLSNTPKQMLVLRAFGVDPPKYAHLPLLHGPDGSKLSKRHGAASVQELRDAGYLSDAVVNYLALLGWGYDDKTTFFSRDEMIEKFSLSSVSKSPAVFDLKKLEWMNGHYIRDCSDQKLADELDRYLRLNGVNVESEKLPAAVAITKEKISTLEQFWPLASFLFEQPEIDRKSWDKVFKDGKGLIELEAARQALELIEPFDSQSIEVCLRDLVDRLSVKPKEVFQPIRVAISGKTISPGIFESLMVLGKPETLVRIDETLKQLQQKN